MADLAPALRRVLQPERQLLGWWGMCDPPALSLASVPVFVMDAEKGQYHGLPEHGVPGLKIGRYLHCFERVYPDAMSRGCEPEDDAVLRAAVARIPRRRRPPAAGGHVPVRQHSRSAAHRGQRAQARVHVHRSKQVSLPVGFHRGSAFAELSPTVRYVELHVHLDDAGTRHGGSAPSVDSDIELPAKALLVRAPAS